MPEAIDAEADFMRRAQEIMGLMDESHAEEPEEEEPEVPEEAPEAPDEDTEEDEEEPGEPEEEDEEEEDEELPKISVRIDGKKADPAEVLKHMTFTPVVDGEELEVSYDELLKGYQRGADYSKKTTELKRLNEEILPYSQMVSYAKHDPQFMSYIEGYFKNGPFPEAANNPLLRVNDDKLSALLDPESDDYDPKQASEVMKARSDWMKKSKERQEVSQKVQQETMQRYSAWAQEQIQRAESVIDGIGGEGEYQRKSESVLASLKEMGFNDNELSGMVPISATDSRAAILAYKAAEYDRIMREAEAPKARLGTKRKRLTPPRSQAAGTGTRPASGTKKHRDNYRKAVGSQKEDDWISVIRNRMNLG